MDISEIIWANGEKNTLLIIKSCDLLEFGRQLVADTMAAARREEADRIKEAEADALITDKDARALFGVTASTLWRWRKRGYIEGIPVGGRIKYRKADCQRILKQAQRENRPYYEILQKK